MSWIRKWKSKKKHYSWKYIERACREIVKTYHPPPPQVIIGLSRGGWVPAVTFANLMGVREVYSMGIASYDSGIGVDLEDQQGSIRTYQRLPINCPGLTKGQPVLIVDDISDKGHTLNHVVNHVRESFGNPIQTATIFTKNGTKFTPDYYYKCVDDDQWIVFPWEVK